MASRDTLTTIKTPPCTATIHQCSGRIDHTSANGQSINAAARNANGTAGIMETARARLATVKAKANIAAMARAMASPSMLATSFAPEP